MNHLKLIILLVALCGCQTKDIEEAKVLDIKKPLGIYEGFSFTHDNSLAIDAEYNRNLTDFSELKNKNQTLSLMWWQTGGSANDDLKHNLTELSKSALAPDVLLLGDYTDSTLPPQLILDLKAIYSFDYFFPLSSRIKNIGIKVFSKIEVSEINQVVDGLRWVSPAFNDRQAWDFMKKWEMSEINRFSNPGWNRNYVRLSLEKNNKLYHIIPVHLCRVWRQTSEFSSDRILGRSANSKKMRSFEDVIKDSSSPVSFQIQHLKTLMKSDAKLKDSQDVIVIGNFNVPLETTVNSFGMDPGTRHFESVFKKPNPTLTSTGSNSLQQIDQIFARGSVGGKTAFSPKFKGSGQYPIYLIIEQP